jgi:hypothetical protein
VEALQAKLKQKSTKHAQYKKMIEKLQLKCSQQQQALVARNTDDKALQDFFYLIAMASKINSETQGHFPEVNAKLLYDKAIKEGIPWNRLIEWVPAQLTASKQ